MKQIYLFILLVCLTTNLYASHSYYPDSYHKDFVSQKVKGDQLRRELLTVLTSKHQKRNGERDLLTNSCSYSDESCYSHRPLSYSEARKYLFGSIHLEKDSQGYFIRGVYCSRDFGGRDFRRDLAPGPMRIPDHNVMNCEHTWPKSRFNSRMPYEEQVADLHHLFPTDSKANSVRSSYRFAEVADGDVAHDDCTSAKIGYAKEQGKKWENIKGYGYDYYFEPPDDHKGNVARALFYFAVRYDLKISPVEEAYLRKWHKEDPVDEFEEWRNTEVMKLQGNRNPFVDYPDLVNLISDF